MSMWEDDWALLGIAPTTELGTIKKAYALKLKVTRPDDDAQAYQALRSAYERVQQWLKWQQQAAAQQQTGTQGEAPHQQLEAPPELVTSATATPELDAPNPVAPELALAPAPSSEPHPGPAEHVVQPHHLIDELELRWRRSGESALMFGWDEARRELDQQPLRRQVEFSTAFAQWALSRPTLPDDFLKALEAHFGWLHDFRTERLLGPALAQALHEALDERLRPRPIDPAVRAVGEPLLRLQALRLAGVTWLKLQWLLFLLQPVLGRSQATLGAQWLQVLGLDMEAQRWTQERVKRGLWLRAGVAVIVYGACAVPVFGDPIIASAHALLWFGATVLLLVLGLAGGRLLGLQLQPITPSARRWSLHLPAWSRGITGVALGIVWLLFASWLARVDGRQAMGSLQQLLPFLPDDLIEYATWAFALCGVTMARPQNGLSRCVIAALFPLAAYLAVQALDAWLPPASGVLIGAAWLLAGAAVHEERFGQPAPTPVQWLLRPVLNTLGLADRWTYTTALMPLAVAAAYATLADGAARPLTLFATWAVGILAVGWLQTKADALGLRQLPQLPGQP